MARKHLHVTEPVGPGFRRLFRTAACHAVTLIVGTIVFALNRTRFEIPSDLAAAIFAMSTIYASFEGGTVAGLLCGLVGLATFAVISSSPDRLFGYDEAGGIRLLVMALTLPAAALLVGRLRDRLARDNVRLRTSEQTWRLLAEQVPDVVLTLKPDGTVYYLNRKLPWTDRTKAETAGRMLSDVVPEENRQQIKKMIPRVLSSGKEQSLEMRHADPDGALVWYELRLVPVRRDEEVFAALAVVTDLSHRLEEESAHERLVAIVQASNAAIFGTTVDGTVTSWNPGARRMYGFAPDEIIGKNFSALLPEGRAGEEAAALVSRAATGEHVEHVESVHRRKDGTPLNVLLSASPIGERTKIEGVAVVSRDLTRQKRDEVDRGRTLALLAEAERIAHVGSWEWDLVTNAMTWTDELYRILGLEPGAVRPSRDAYLQHIVNEDRERVKQALRKAREEATPFSFDNRIIRPDGEERIVRVHGAVQRDAAGKPTRLVGTVHDVTAFRKMETELRARRRDLETEVRRRTDQLHETEFRLKTLLGSSPLIMWATDGDLRFTLSEGKGLEALGLKPGQVVGRLVGDVYKKYPAVIENHRRALAGEAVKGSFLVEGRAYETTYVPLRDATGAIYGVMGVALDVTDMKA